MDLFSIVINTLAIAAMIGVFFILFNFLLKVEYGLGKAVAWVTKPVQFLFDRLTAGLPGFLLMFAAALVALGYVAYRFMTAADYLNALLTVATGTTLGNLVYLFATGMDFQGYVAYAAPIGVAFGSFLGYAYMKFTLEKLDEWHMKPFFRWFLLFVLNLIFIAFSSLLAERMTVFFAQAAQWINTHFLALHRQLSNAQVHTFRDILPLIGPILAILPIVLAGALVLLITVREYLACALYSVATIFLLLVLGVLISLVPLPMVSDLLCLLIFFGIDYIRADDVANRKFRNKVRDVSKKFWGFFTGIFRN